MLFAVAVSADDSTPVPILRQINRVNDDGSYTFGFEAEDGSFRIETRDNNGNVKGKYGYVDETGEIKTVEYSAGKEVGFSASGTHLPEPVPAVPAPAASAPVAAPTASPSVRVPSLPALAAPAPAPQQPRFSVPQPTQQPQFTPEQFQQILQLLQAQNNIQPRFAPQQFNQQPQFVPQQFNQQPQFLPQQFNQQPRFPPQQFNPVQFAVQDVTTEAPSTSKQSRAFSFNINAPVQQQFPQQQFPQQLFPQQPFPQQFNNQFRF